MKEITAKKTKHLLQPSYAEEHLFAMNFETDVQQQQKTAPFLSAEDRKPTVYMKCYHRKLHWHSDGEVRIGCKEHESMDPSCGGGLTLVKRIFSWNTFSCLLSIV